MQRLSGSVRELRDRSQVSGDSRTTARRKARTPLNLYTEMLTHLLEGGVTAQEIAHLSQCSVQSVQKFLKELKKKKLIYISGWYLSHNQRIKLPQFKMGNRADSEKPKPLPKALIRQRYRARKKIKDSFNPFYAICRNEETRAV